MRCCRSEVISDSEILYPKARQASLSFTISWSVLKLMSIESVVAIQPPDPLSPPSPPALNLLKLQGLFQWVGSSHQVTKILELQHQSLQWIQDWFPLGWTGWISLQSKGTLKSLLQHNSKASVPGFSASFMVQVSQACVTTGKTIPLTIQIRCTNPTDLSWQLSIAETTQSGRIRGCRHTKGKVKGGSSTCSIIFRTIPSVYCPPVISREWPRTLCKCRATLQWPQPGHCWLLVNGPTSRTANHCFIPGGTEGRHFHTLSNALLLCLFTCSQRLHVVDTKH